MQEKKFKPRRNLIGKKFHKFTIIDAFTDDKIAKKVLVKCLCECGSIFVINCQNIYGKRATKSCGCLLLNKTKHGHSPQSGFSLTYCSWDNMKRRTQARYAQAKRGNYPDMIKNTRAIDPAWNLFENFLKDMGERPSKAHSIDRIDNNKGYSKENCRWATQKEQANNTSRCINLTIDGQTKTLKQWTEFHGLNYTTVRGRISSGWPSEKWFIKTLR